MLEGRLGLLATRDVAHAEDLQRLVVLETHRADGHVGGEAPAAALAADRLARVQVVEERTHVAADHVGSRVAEDALGGRIERGDAIRLVDGDDAFSHVIEHRAQVCLVRTQLLEQLRITDRVGGQGSDRV